MAQRKENRKDGFTGIISAFPILLLISKGHSLGGYLSVNYCLKYPSHVDRLILVSPVGVPNNPYETSQDVEKDPSIVDPPDSTVQSEFSQPQSPPSKTAIQQPRPLPRWVTLLWEANFSPFLFVRLPIVGP